MLRILELLRNKLISEHCILKLMSRHEISSRDILTHRGSSYFTIKGWLVPLKVERVATSNLKSRHLRNFCQLAV